MKSLVTPSQLNRLAIAIMEHFHTDYEGALARLKHLQLIIDCGNDVGYSVNLQVALLSAVNAGKRAFLGGVFVKLPAHDLRHLTPLPAPASLVNAIQKYGGHVINNTNEVAGFTLTLGKRCESNNNSLEMIVGDWVGGIATAEDPVEVDCRNILPMGAAAAAAIGVGCAFFKASGIEPRCTDAARGISLWRPDLDWVSDEAKGPAVNELPAKVWLLGLGHLGQAYIWNLVCLPFEDRSKVQLMLQDDDRVSPSNYTSGLLTEHTNVGQLKTMICRQWLDAGGFDTRITERRFNEHTFTVGEEPLVALCGFDNALSRHWLENSGFDLVVEAGIGGTASDFDDVVLHTFPSRDHSANKLWPAHLSESGIHHAQVYKVFEHLKEGDCGNLPIQLSGQAISSAFVGLLAGAFATAELVRACCCGPRFQEIHARVSTLHHMKAFEEGKYTTQIGRNGTVPVSSANYEFQQFH